MCDMCFVSVKVFEFMIRLSPLETHYVNTNRPLKTSYQNTHMEQTDCGRLDSKGEMIEIVQDTLHSLYMKFDV